MPTPARSRATQAELEKLAVEMTARAYQADVRRR